MKKIYYSYLYFLLFVLLAPMSSFPMVNELIESYDLEKLQKDYTLGLEIELRGLNQLQGVELVRKYLGGDEPILRKGHKFSYYIVPNTILGEIEVQPNFIIRPLAKKEYLDKYGITNNYTDARIQELEVNHSSIEQVTAPINIYQVIKFVDFMVELSKQGAKGTGTFAPLSFQVNVGSPRLNITTIRRLLANYYSHSKELRKDFNPTLVRSYYLQNITDEFLRQLLDKNWSPNSEELFKAYLQGSHPKLSRMNVMNALLMDPENFKNFEQPSYKILPRPAVEYREPNIELYPDNPEKTREMALRTIAFALIMMDLAEKNEDISKIDFQKIHSNINVLSEKLTNWRNRLVDETANKNYLEKMRLKNLIAKNYGSLRSLESDQSWLSLVPESRWWKALGVVLPSFKRKGVIDNEYLPDAGNVIKLAVFMIPKNQLNWAGINNQIPEEFVEGEKVRFFVHPFNKELVKDLELRYKRDSHEWIATPTASTRTMHVVDTSNSEKSYDIKLSLDAVLAGSRRMVQTVQIGRAVQNSEIYLAANNIENIDIMPEVFGAIPKRWTSGGGYIVRKNPTKFNPEKHEIFSYLALQGGFNGSQLLNEIFQASGKNTMEEFLWEDLIKPTLKMIVHFSVEGVPPEIYLQNGGFYIDKQTKKIVRVFAKDFDSLPLHKAIRSLKYTDYSHQNFPIDGIINLNLARN